MDLSLRPQAAVMLLLGGFVFAAVVQRGWGDATADPTPEAFSIAPGAAH